MDHYENWQILENKFLKVRWAPFLLKFYCVEFDFQLLIIVKLNGYFE